MYVCVYVCMCVCGKNVNPSFDALYLWHAVMDQVQTWVLGVTWEPSYVNEVKGHIPRSKVM